MISFISIAMEAISALNDGGAFNILQIAYKLLANRHHLLGALGHGATKTNNVLEEGAVANLVIQPKIHRLVALRALIGVIEEQVGQRLQNAWATSPNSAPHGAPSP